MSPTPNSTVACPRCGKPITLTPHPGKSGRLIGECGCNVDKHGAYLGPVIETNMGQPAAEWPDIKRIDMRKQAGSSTEVKHDSTVS